MSDSTLSVAEKRRLARERLLNRAEERLAKITGGALPSAVQEEVAGANGAAEEAATCPAPTAASPAPTAAAPPPEAPAGEAPDLAPGLRLRKGPAAASSAEPTSSASDPPNDGQTEDPSTALLKDTVLTRASFTDACNAALFTTTAYRCASDVCMAQAALRSGLLPASVPPVLLLVAMNLAIILSTALFYVGSLGDLKAAVKQQRLRDEPSEGGQMLAMLFKALGVAERAAGLQCGMLVLYALYIDSSVYLASAVLLHLALDALTV